MPTLLTFNSHIQVALTNLHEGYKLFITSVPFLCKCLPNELCSKLKCFTKAELFDTNIQTIGGKLEIAYK